MFITKRREYGEEFKREAIVLTRQPGVSCRQIALEVGTKPNFLSKWRREADTGTDKVFRGLGSPWGEDGARFFARSGNVRRK